MTNWTKRSKQSITSSFAKSTLSTSYKGSWCTRVPLRVATTIRLLKKESSLDLKVRRTGLNLTTRR